MIIITLPFTAYADNENGNGTGDAGSSGTHIIAGGAASSKRCGIYYYVQDNYGKTRAHGIIMEKQS